MMQQTVISPRLKHKIKEEDHDMPMNIMTLSIPDNICCNMELPPKITLADFKLIAQLKLDIDETQQIVMFKGRQLDDPDRELQSYGIGQKSIVYVIRRQAEQPNISIVVKYKTAQKTVVVAMSQPRSDLQKIAAEIYQFQQAYTKLIYCGGVLTGTTIAQCRLVHMAVVNVKRQEILRTRSKSMVIEHIKEEEVEEPEELQPIEELAKEVESIEDIDGEIFNELMKIQEISETDSLLDQMNFAPQNMCRKKRSFPLAQTVLLQNYARIKSLRCESPAVELSIDLQKGKKGEDGELTTSGSMIEKNPSFTYTPAPKPNINFGQCQTAKLWQFRYV